MAGRPLRRIKNGSGSDVLFFQPIFGPRSKTYGTVKKVIQFLRLDGRHLRVVAWCEVGYEGTSELTARSKAVRGGVATEDTVLVEIESIGNIDGSSFKDHLQWLKSQRNAREI